MCCRSLAQFGLIVGGVLVTALMIGVLVITKPVPVDPPVLDTAGAS